MLKQSQTFTCAHGRLHTKGSCPPNTSLPSQFRKGLICGEEQSQNSAAPCLWPSLHTEKLDLFPLGRVATKTGRKEAEIYAIYVLPDFWNQGIGQELLDGAERKVEDNNFIAITLWVLEKNALGRRFYEARGFRLDAARKEETIGGLLLTELRYEKKMFNLKPVGSG